MIDSIMAAVENTFMERSMVILIVKTCLIDPDRAAWKSVVHYLIKLRTSAICLCMQHINIIVNALAWNAEICWQIL